MRQERSVAPESADTQSIQRSHILPGWQLSGVTFRYPDAKMDVIQQLNLQIKAGSTLVITGTSGAGKSTLLALLLGEFEPTAGEIQLLMPEGAIPLQSGKKRLLQHMGYVGPEPFLIDGTIHENLVYGLNTRELPTAADLDLALQQAECGFIHELQLQLGHRIDEQGQGLSAGQKQRLSLARALLRKPTVLILDEATSNLDIATEASLVKILGQLKQKMTIVAVTHRTEILRIADEHLQLSSNDV